MTLPILDPVPSGKPHDYSLRSIRRVQAKVPTAVVQTPEEWHNPNQKHLFHTDQKNGGTCTGQAAVYGFQHNYIRLTGDIPTPEEIAAIKRNVIDSLGSLVDIPPPHTFSPESAYQMGRAAGNITYPSGGEIRFVAKAMRDYGINLESQWHSDKERTNVWVYPPGARETPDGGLSPEKAAEFAALHRIQGWAMVGTPDGDATYDEICAAIYKYGWVMAAIPIYTNFVEIQGQEHPIYPLPNGELDGFHAQCIDGFSQTSLDCEHSWWGFCGQHGEIPKGYYDFARDQCVWLVWIDEDEVAIGKEIHTSLEINCNVPAKLYVGGVLIGNIPQKIAIEKGNNYQITVSADGYIAHSQVVDESTSSPLMVVLEPLPLPVEPKWYQNIIDFFIGLWEIITRRT